MNVIMVAQKIKNPKTGHSDSLASAQTAFVEHCHSSELLLFGAPPFHGFFSEAWDVTVDGAKFHPLQTFRVFSDHPRTPINLSPRPVRGKNLTLRTSINLEVQPYKAALSVPTFFFLYGPASMRSLSASIRRCSATASSASGELTHSRKAMVLPRRCFSFSIFLLYTLVSCFFEFPGFLAMSTIS